jgi:hypothetical protein
MMPKRVRNSQLRRFHLRVEARKGKKVTIVALARRILTIISGRKKFLVQL